LRGFEAELRVIKLYLEKGFSLKSHRKEYFNTEIDIVMESNSKVILIEVKYTTHEDFIFYRMTPSQKRRLENVYLRWVHSTPKEVEFHYVIVSQSEEFQIFEDFLSS
jgi:Holliday junction resolvase-like predicted endonuclease